MTTEREAILARINRDRNLERGGIGPVPAHRKTGRLRDQFTFWFGANATILGLLAGFAGPSVFGLTLVYSLLAAALGAAAGAALTGAMGSLGPTSGLVQILFARFTLGRRPAKLLEVGSAIYCYVRAGLAVGAGTIVLRTVLHAAGLSFAYDSLVLAVALAAIAAFVASQGYRWMHGWQQRAAMTAFYTLSLLTIALCLHPSDGRVATSHLLASFFGMAAASFGLTAAWIPYASDYSRGLPEGTRGVFGRVFWGITLGAVWTESLGALIATEGGRSVGGGLLVIFGNHLVILVVLVLIGLSAVSNATPGYYSGVNSLIACVTTNDRRSLTWVMFSSVMSIGYGASLHQLGGVDAVMALATHWVVPFAVITLYLLVTRPWLFSPSAWESRRYTRRGPFAFLAFGAGIAGAWVGSSHVFGILGQGTLGGNAALGYLLAGVLPLALLVGRDIYTMARPTSIDVPTVA